MSDRFITLSFDGPVRVMALSLPELLESGAFDALNESVRSAINAAPGSPWVLDLTNVSYMGSSVLGLMVNTRQTIKQAGGTLVLCGLSPRLADIFRTCSLQRLFTITISRAEAARRARP